MNFKVFIDNHPTGRVVVNSPSEESARKVWEYFEGKSNLENVTFTPVEGLNVPKMFKNCIINEKDIS